MADDTGLTARRLQYTTMVLDGGELSHTFADGSECRKESQTKATTAAEVAVWFRCGNALRSTSESSRESSLGSVTAEFDRPTDRKNQEEHYPATLVAIDSSWEKVSVSCRYDFHERNRTVNR